MSPWLLLLTGGGAVTLLVFALKVAEYFLRISGNEKLKGVIAEKDLVIKTHEQNIAALTERLDQLDARVTDLTADLGIARARVHELEIYAAPAAFAELKTLITEGFGKLTER